MFGVLKGRATAAVPEYHGRTPHFHVQVDAAGERFRVSVDVRSYDHGQLLCHIDEDFRHPLTAELLRLEDGFHRAGHGAPRLDYVRGGLVRREQMAAIPHALAGPDNDLNDRLDGWVRRAMEDHAASLVAFGGRWGPEPARPDAVFGFRPGNGLHDVHMNQGSPRGRHDHDNGVGQDGALFVHLPAAGRWIAIFLAFQSQSWHTDPATGHPLDHDD